MALEPMELEHVIGFSGRRPGALLCHPRDPDSALLAMGNNVVVQNLRDDHDQVALQGHDEPVSVMAVSARGTFVASGQEGSTQLAVPEAQVIVWDLAQRVDVYRLRGIRGGVTALAFSPDEMFLAGAGADGALLFWDIQTGEVVGNMGAHEVCSTLVWGALEPGSSGRRPDYVLFATVGHHVKTFRLSYSVGNMTYEVREAPFRLPAGMVRQFSDSCLTPCGTHLLLSTSIGDVNVFQVDCLMYRASFPVCSGGARAICAAGPFVFVGGGDGTIKRLMGQQADWHLGAESSIPGGITSMSALYDKDRDKILLLVGTETGTVHCLDGHTLRASRSMQSETSPLVGAAFKAGCSIRFATINQNGCVRVWDLLDYSIVAEGGAAHGEQGLCVWFDEHEDQVLAGLDSGAVRAFCATRGPTAGQLGWEIPRAHRDGVSALCATKLFYATGGARGGVRIWSRSSRAQLFEFADHIGKPVAALVPDCRQPHLLHSCGADRSVFTFDLKKEKRLVHHQWDHGGVFTSMSQRLDSENELVTAGTDGRLLTWDLDVPDPVSQVTQSGAFTCVRVSPATGRFIAASSSDARVRVWDLWAKGALVATSPANGFHGITALAWSPDEKQLVSVGSDKCICIWNFYADAIATAEHPHK